MRRSDVWTKRTQLTLVAAVVWTAGVASDVAGQRGLPRSPRLEAGVGAGVIVDYPTQFSEDACGPSAVSLGVDAIYRPVPFLGIEGSLVVSDASGGASCVAVEASFAPTPIGVPVRRTRYPSSVRGGTSIATNLAMVVEPFSSAPLGPRGRLGVARLWNKDLGAWFAGGGLRYRFGRHSLIMDVERWMIHIDAFDEVVVYQQSGDVTVLSRDRATVSERSYLVRVGWEVVVR